MWLMVAFVLPILNAPDVKWVGGGRWFAGGRNAGRQISDGKRRLSMHLDQWRSGSRASRVHFEDGISAARGCQHCF